MSLKQKDPQNFGRNSLHLRFSAFGSKEVVKNLLGTLGKNGMFDADPEDDHRCVPGSIAAKMGRKGKPMLIVQAQNVRIPLYPTKNCHKPEITIEFLHGQK